MLVEERIYTLQPGMLPKYLADYEASGLPLQIKYLGKPWGYFVVDVGQLSQIVHLWRYENYADRERRRAALAQDSEWLTVVGRLATMIAEMENRILVPTSFMEQRQA